MNYSFLTGLKKSAITAAVVAAGVALSSFFGAFDEVSEWTAFGAPQLVALAAIAGVEAARNFVKQLLKSL